MGSQNSTMHVNIFGVPADDHHGLVEMSQLDLEELKMLSGFDVFEIDRTLSCFSLYTNGAEIMTKEMFSSVDWVANSPLQDRLCKAFGFEYAQSKINAKQFLEAVSNFNSTGMGRRERKMKTAFMIQDMDGDGFISHTDLCEYLIRITADNISKQEIGLIADHVIAETCSDPKTNKISYSDFQRVMAPSDFHTKFRLPL